MSAADNKRLMQTIFEKIAAGDRAAFVDSLADDVVMRVTGQNSWSQTFRGKDALLRDLYGYLATLVAEGRRTIPHRLIADGDHVVVEAVGEMQTKAGVPYNNDYCLIYRLRDGKIVEIREYLDSALCERVLGPYPATRTQIAG
jgi:ketosteroid isomerase-like protein